MVATSEGDGAWAQVARLINSPWSPERRDPLRGNPHRGRHVCVRGILDSDDHQVLRVLGHTRGITDRYGIGCVAAIVPFHVGVPEALQRLTDVHVR